MDSKLLEGIIQTLIYGIRCVAAQTQHVKHLMEEKTRRLAITNLEEKVADFIAKFYVDDGGESVANQKDADDLIMKTDEVLSSTKMKIKGWSVSYRSPSVDVAGDDASVGFAGMTWVPELDTFSIKIQPLHFGKKKRGRFPESLEKYDGGSFADFVPKMLTRRMCSSVTARIYDIPGLVAPLVLKLKFDIRRLIEAGLDWDTPMSEELRQRWIQNFEFIEEMRDVLYIRCRIPPDAKRCTVVIWLQCDTSPGGGIIINAYSCHERRDGSWSCQLLCAKSILVPKGWTTPQAELHALSALASLAYVLWKLR